MTPSGPERVDLLVLAGDRGPDDALARQAQVWGKALVPVAGHSMLERVLTALHQWPRRGRVVLVAPDRPDYRDAASRAGFSETPDGVHQAELVWINPAASLMSSVRSGLAACAGDLCLLVTADHALLDAAWLDHLLASVLENPDAGVWVGLADWHSVMARFPGSRRTRYRFRDRSICGTNLFALRKSTSEPLLDVWQQVEQQRKRPWRIVAVLGWANLTAYLAGRLSLEQAFAALSTRIGTRIEAIHMPDPLTAVDVDSLADLALVEQVLAERGGSAC